MSGHKTARADHQVAAQQAREVPGTWVLAGVYGSHASAATTAREVSKAERIPAYRPAGTFDAYTAITDDGVDLYVRYIEATAVSFRESVAAGLTEDLEAFSRRLDAATTTKGRP
ncbi:hypothetical protein ABZX77_05735 [Streptomyces sp. NPDC004237]|uniref:hypothetical protein n=1 Tax=Streptomyces sp. NPDC004237 TaxID=3154455 RepID=UPI0033BDB793